MAPPQIESYGYIVLGLDQLNCSSDHAMPHQYYTHTDITYVQDGWFCLAIIIGKYWLGPGTSFFMGSPRLAVPIEYAYDISNTQ